MWRYLCFFLFLSPVVVLAIPTQVLSQVRGEENELNDKEISNTLLARSLWDGSSTAPGNWQSESSVTGTSSSYLLASPKFMGLKTVLLRATHRHDYLEELQITFADAGSFFGYYQEKAPTGLSKKESRVWHQKNFDQRNAEFQTIIMDSRKALKSALGKIDRKPRKISQGRTRTLKAEMLQYKYENLNLRLLDVPNRLLRLIISRDQKPVRSWLDRELATQTERTRLASLKDAVSKSENGDLILTEVQIVPQGYRPYCGLNTLAMTGRYLGLHLDEDWLAVAGKFQNTGTAAGSQMLSLYQAVAKEAGFKLERKSHYDQTSVRRSLQNGMPVIVWRRWSQERDREHRRIASIVSRGGSEKFSHDPSASSSYPDEKSPLHASVIIGLNEKRNEVIFLESWAGQSCARRMSIAEMEKTAYLTFCFQP